ncbi:hypothetical protein AVEN_182257-1 [Araneus ventricosus]|uniref:PH domain-containing protein n=1 Tax=Araneus ventricosus TaxID=182803 RepID=A0A4Y2H8T3_ARAVE|nr:hypothetical protein AVEN_182257-1 [Araneus ventricosus]
MKIQEKIAFPPDCEVKCRLQRPPRLMVDFLRKPNGPTASTHCFVITYRKEGSKHYEMKAETEADCMNWIRSIDSAR